MMGRWLNGRLARLPLAAAGLLLLALLAAPAALADGPITWSPADSTYGPASTAFFAAPFPLPAGTGMTSVMPGLGTVYGAGFWDATQEVYAMGFVNAIPMSAALPAMPATDLTGTVMAAGTPLTLVFHKAAGVRVDSIAMLGAPDALVAVDPAEPAALTAATQFTVRASVTDPVASASGDVGAAFGLVVDCSRQTARDFQGSLFVTDMHWLDIDPPTFNAAGLAGLSAHGANGTQATFDGILAPAFLAGMGVADPAQVQGYVDVTAVTGWTGATFTVMGAGDGALWPSGSYKYRITNSTWSTHNILFGKLSKPAKAAGVSPKGTISGTRPTFKWKKIAVAKSYDVMVYKGSKLILKKTGVSTLTWKASKSLPRTVYLTWKVRGVNTAGPGVYSAALKFKIR
jgi:hypothetical protein